MKSANKYQSTAVIITAKDAAATAARAVSSALAQQSVREVVFVDDGSVDNTSEVAASVDDGSGRLSIIRLDQNRGPAYGRNVAIDASSAPFLCILDADDFISDDRLDRLFLRGGDDWDLLADNIVFISGPKEDQMFDRLLPNNFRVPCELTLSTFVVNSIPASRCSRRNGYRRELVFLKPVVRRSFLEAHGLRYDERLRIGEDFLLYTECLIAGAVFRVVEECGYYAVQRQDSLSGAHSTDNIAAFYQALVELETRTASAGRSLGKYITSTRNKLALARVHDAKRSGGWSGFLIACAKSPSSLAYIFCELLHAKVAKVGTLFDSNRPLRVKLSVSSAKDHEQENKKINKWGL
jgi:succinoglycan biosynthesis protein ExoU